MLVILEGLDRTGKTTVAEIFKAKGFEVIHQKAPVEGTTEDNYLEEQIQIVQSASNRDVLLDRSYYGELVWPEVFGRKTLLSTDGLETLRELEQLVGIQRILMHDQNVEAHWRRCVENKEPLNKVQFVNARKLFYEVAEKHGFERKTVHDFGVRPAPVQAPVPVKSNGDRADVAGTDQGSGSGSLPGVPSVSPTKEQVKLETANAINDVLSRRLLKQKGPIYDKLETDLRTFLNTELGKIFGAAVPATPGQFNSEEVELLKFFAKKLKENSK